jgi:hypothetical protein
MTVNKPILGITMGDPPLAEVTVSAFEEITYQNYRPLLFGDAEFVVNH